MKNLLNKFKKKKQEVNSLEEIDLTEMIQDEFLWIVNHIGDLVKENLNDQDLGAAVREFYRSKFNQLKEQSDDGEV